MKKNSKLIFRLAGNDIKSKYASSFFGVIWAFIMPLITIIVFWFVFQMGFRNNPVDNAPYILWFAAAYIPWIYFTDILVSGCGCMVEYSFLVKKIRFDIWILPIVKLLAALWVHLFFIGFLVVMCLLYRVPLTVYLFQIFYYTLGASILGLGFSYLFSSFTVFFKDMTSIVNIIVQIGFWVTPIIWNEKTIVDTRVSTVLRWNPAHYFTNGYRECLIDHKWFWENPVETIYFWSAVLVILLLGIYVFRKFSHYFADEI